MFKYYRYTTTMQEETNSKVMGRPRKYEYIEIEQPINDEPIERKTKEKYHSQYYQNHKEIKVQCPICSKTVQKYTIGKHQKTQYCQLVKKNLERSNFHIENVTVV